MLCGDRDAGRLVIDGGEQAACPGVETLHSMQTALADRRQHLVLRDRDTDMTEAQPLQAGEREQRRLDLNALALGQARVDIAAQRDDLQIGAATQELGAPAQRGGADDRTLPPVGDAPADTIPASVLCSLMTGRRACPFAPSRLVSGLQQTLCRGNAFAVRTNARIGIEVLHRLRRDERDRRSRMFSSLRRIGIPTQR